MIARKSNTERGKEAGAGGRPQEQGQEAENPKAFSICHLSSVIFHLVGNWRVKIVLQNDHALKTK